jgi:predicted MFS family arabinose efflux permease
VSAEPRASFFAPFRVRNFRFQWPADLLTSLAFEMEILILGWYILVETGSVLLLTVFGALMFLGTLFSPMLGVIGDRFGQRNLLCGMRVIYAVLAASLLALALNGLLTPMRALVIAGLNGLVRPSDIGMRAALVAQNMPHERLMNAMSISRTTSDSARVAGALVGAGLFAQFGIGPAYIVVATFYGIGLLLTLAISRAPAATVAEDMQTEPVKRPSPWRDLTEGVAYVWRTPHLRAAMWLAFLVNLTAFPLTHGLLPYVAKDIYHVDQTGLGLLVASFSLGALVGSIVLGIIGHRLPLTRMMVIFAGVWHLMLFVFAHVDTARNGVLVLLVVGMAQSFSLVPLAVMLMRTSAAKFRGRVMGVRMLAIYSLPLGLLAAGALIARIGFSNTVTLYAAIGLTFTVVIGWRWRSDLWHPNETGKGR